MEGWGPLMGFGSLVYRLPFPWLFNGNCGGLDFGLNRDEVERWIFNVHANEFLVAVEALRQG